jgi:hypothetical protein
VSLPISAPTKRAPRPGRRQIITKACEVCGTLFRPHYSSPGRFCSVACRAKTQVGINWGRTPQVDWAKRLGRTSKWMRRHRVSRQAYAAAMHDGRWWLRWCTPPHDIECQQCGRTFVGLRVRFCPECRSQRQREQARRQKTRRAAAKRGAIKADRYRASEIYERDGWRCHLCRRLVKRQVVVPHPLAPTIDHLIPISDGGPDIRTNVATAHFRCNYQRQAGGNAQLRWSA